LHFASAADYTFQPLIVPRTYLNDTGYKLIHIKEEYDEDDDVGEH